MLYVNKLFLLMILLNLFARTSEYLFVCEIIVQRVVDIIQRMNEFMLHPPVSLDYSPVF